MIEFSEFAESYSEHIRWLGLGLPSKKSFKILHELYCNVIHNGGWARTIGLDNWEFISEVPGPRQLYESSHLVSFERRIEKTWTYNALESVQIDYSLLKTIRITTSIRLQDWDEIQSEDLVLFRDVYKLGVAKDLISLKSLKANHGNEEISVIVQEANTSGFSVKKATKQTMVLKNYLKLMEKHVQDRNTVKFAVNIDIGNWEKEIDELRKVLPANVLWNSNEDALKYLRQNILGMTLPQLYLKVKGCWTGGHEENLRFSSANINHGPNDCEWWGLDSTQALQLRKCVKRDHNFEIYNSETLWWPDEIYCIFNGLTIYHVIQKPGDLIIVGPGTIHWVKSCGVTTNTAWNFGPKLLNNFKRSFERNWINWVISYKSLVPMHILALDLLNSELDSLDIGLVQLFKEEIQVKNKEEIEEFQESKLKSVILHNLDNVINCEVCYIELFRIYYRCERCMKNRLKGSEDKCFFCWNCVSKEHRNNCKGKVQAVEKFTEEMLEELWILVELRLIGYENIGNVPDLVFPFHRDHEEGVYVSKYNGVYKDIPKSLEVEKAISKKVENLRNSRSSSKAREKTMADVKVCEKAMADTNVRGKPVKIVKVARLQSQNAKRSMNSSRSKIDLGAILTQEKILIAPIGELGPNPILPEIDLLISQARPENPIIAEEPLINSEVPQKSLPKPINIKADAKLDSSASETLLSSLGLDPCSDFKIPFKRSSDLYKPVMDMIPKKSQKLA